MMTSKGTVFVSGDMSCTHCARLIFAEVQKNGKHVNQG